MTGARVLVHAPEHAPRAVAVDAVLEVGRAADGLALTDERCSRRHCRFEAAPTGLVVEDLGSTNGTWVNGAAIVGPTRVHAGDVVVVGSTRIVVDTDGAPATSDPSVSAELDATVVRLRARRSSAARSPSRSPTSSTRPRSALGSVTARGVRAVGASRPPDAAAGRTCSPGP